MIPIASGWAKTGVVGGAALLALIGFAVPAAKTKIAERRAADAEVDAQAAGTMMRVAMSDSLLPVLSYVVTGVDPRSKDSCDVVAAEAVAMVLASAARVCDRSGASRARACWYEMDFGSNGDPADVVLRPKRHFGRGVCPTTTFAFREPRGEALFRLLMQDKPELCSDLAVGKPLNWKATRNDETSYKSYMAIPVRTSARPFGFLMVDSDEPGGLVDEDVPVVQVLAGILALALAMRPAVALPSGRPASRPA